MSKAQVENLNSQPCQPVPGTPNMPHARQRGVRVVSVGSLRFHYHPMLGWGLGGLMNVKTFNSGNEASHSPQTELPVQIYEEQWKAPLFFPATWCQA